MIAAITSNTKFHNVIVSTGNVLNINNKCGVKSSEELLDALQLTLQCEEAAEHVELNEAEGLVQHATPELQQKLTENERSEISIGAKIFLSKVSSAAVEKAVQALLEILKVPHVDNVILAYHPEQAAGGSAAAAIGIIDAETEEERRRLWAALESFAQRKQIVQLGVADLNKDQLQQLCTTANVPPTIMQIDYAWCSEIPPELEEFCTQHDILLLAHNDPEVMVGDEEFIVPGYQVDWTLRYQVHVRWRAVLTAKGYILGASKGETSSTIGISDTSEKLLEAEESDSKAHSAISE